MKTVESDEWKVMSEKNRFRCYVLGVKSELKT